MVVFCSSLLTLQFIANQCYESVRFFYGSGYSDPYSDFSDPDSDPYPTDFLTIVKRTMFFKHYIPDKKFSEKQINVTGDQREEIYVHKTYNFQFVNMIF